MNELETTPLDQFEASVVNLLLAGEHPVLVALRSQREMATVRARESHSTGILVDLWIPDSQEPIEQRERFSLDDAVGRLVGVEAEASFYLHLNRGRLATLEVLLDGGEWPQIPQLDQYYFVGRDSSGEQVQLSERDLNHALRGLDPANHLDKGGQPGPISG